MLATMTNFAVPDILCHPRRWQFIGAGFPSDVSPVEHARHRHWMAAHTHRHAHQEFLLVLHGQGQHGLNGDIYPLAPGTVLFFDTFEPHDEFVPAWVADAEHLWIMCLHDQCRLRRLRVTRGAIRWLEEWDLLLAADETGLSPYRCLAAVGAQSVLPPEFRRLRIQATVEGIIAAAIQALLSGDDPEDRGSFQQRIIATTRRHIEQTAGHGITLDQLARIAGYSKCHFLRLFKQYTGYTVHQYIDRCRAERVDELTVRGLSKTQIAHALGFSCQPAFSRWYQRWKGG